jgi:hypothetical protein
MEPSANIRRYPQTTVLVGVMGGETPAESGGQIPQLLAVQRQLFAILVPHPVGAPQQMRVFVLGALEADSSGERKTLLRRIQNLQAVADAAAPGQGGDRGAVNRDRLEEVGDQHDAGMPGQGFGRRRAGSPAGNRHRLDQNIQPDASAPSGHALAEQTDILAAIDQQNRQGRRQHVGALCLLRHVAPRAVPHGRR